MIKLILWLTRAESLALERSSFSHPVLGGELRAVRGKTCGAYKGFSTFQWTPAVQSMVILALRTSASARGGGGDNAIIQGFEGSPASSLDYSIGKTPAWMLDVFGIDKLGTPLARRLFHRTNPERKRGGPVAVSINEHILSGSGITIFINDRRVENPSELLQAAQEVENIFRSERRKSANSKTRSQARAVSRDVAQEQFPTKVKAVQAQDARHRSIICPCCGEELSLSSVSAKAA